MSGTRERVRITLQTEDMSNQIKVEALVGNLPTLIEGDRIKVTYDLFFDYMGETYDNLTRIEKLLDSPNVVGQADLSALNGGKILLQEIIRKIDRITGRLAIKVEALVGNLPTLIEGDRIKNGSEEMQCPECGFPLPVGDKAYDGGFCFKRCKGSHEA